MAVPGHDSRDFAFARNFKLPIIQVVVRKGEEPTDPASWEESYDSKEGLMINSGFINDMEVKAAIQKTINWLEEKEYESVKQMQGSVSQSCAIDPAAYEHSNYVNIIKSYRP